MNAFCKENLEANYVSFYLSQYIKYHFMPIEFFFEKLYSFYTIYIF